MRFAVPALLGLTLAAGIPSAASAVAEIQWWHAMAGASNEVVEQLASDFNSTQSDYKVRPVYKGTYPEELNAGLAAFRAGDPPAIIQVFDVGTGVMMAAEGAIIPVADIMKKAGITFDKNQYLPGIVSYYSKPDGTMLSFPFNTSSPILFYNKDIFQRVGLDPDKPPLTWPEVWEAARTIKENGAATCGYTSAWLAWIHLENFAAWNNLQYGTNQNGMAGPKMELTFNTPIFVHHMQDIADLAQDGVFKYGGRTSEAKPYFLSGECAIYTDSSAALGDVKASGINFGTGPLPYDPDASGPQNTIPGGASLWVFAGKSDTEYKGVAAFFKYLSQTDTQARLHQVSGYLPATMAAYNATRQSGFYDANPGREQPIKQMMGKEPTDNSKGIRAANLPQLRDIENEEIETMLAGQQTAREALDRAVARGNEAIKQGLAQ